MEWLQNNQRRLSALSAIALVAALGVIVAARVGGNIALASWQLGLAVLPWAVFTAAFLPLVYLSWFGRPRPRILTIAGKLFFWLLALAVVMTFGAIYGSFVFGVW